MDFDVLQTFAKASKTNYEEVFLSKETGWSQIQPKKADLNKIHQHYTTPPPPLKKPQIRRKMPFPSFSSSLFTVGVCKQGACLQSGGRERKEEGQKKFTCVGRRKSAKKGKELLREPNSPLACVVTEGKFLFLVAKHAGTRGEGNSFFWN